MKRSLIIFLLFGSLFLPLFVSAAICPNAGASTELCNPTGIRNLPEFGYFILQAFAVVIGWQVIARVMFAGFRMIVSQGNSEEIEKSQSALQWSIYGLILAIFSFFIVAGIARYIGVRETSDGVAPPESLNPLFHPTFGSLFKAMIERLLIVAGALALLMIIISGFRYMTARGNEEQAENAKNGLLWSVLGLVIVLMAYVIVVATAQLFGLTVTG